MRNICKVLALNLIYAVRKHSYISFAFTTLLVIFSAVSVLVVGASVEGSTAASKPIQQLTQTTPVRLDLQAQVAKLPTLRQTFIKKTPPPTQPPTTVTEQIATSPTAPPVTTEALTQKEPSKEPTAVATSFRVAAIRLSQPEVTCQNGQYYLTIDAASLVPQASPYQEVSINWAWEVRADMGQYETSPVSAEPQNMTLAPGNGPVNLMSKTAAKPLVAAPMNAQYSYSFRLHVTSPNDAYSDWIAVSQSVEGACTPA